MKTDVKLFLLNKLMDYRKDTIGCANVVESLLRLFYVEADSKEIENAMLAIQDARNSLSQASESLHDAYDQIINTLIFEDKIIS